MNKLISTLINLKKRLSLVVAVVLITALVSPFAAVTGVAVAETISGNTAGTVASVPVATGGAGEYAFSLLITSSTVSGVTAGQLVWCAATTADFPNLLTMGAALNGDLDHSAGWWVFKTAVVVTPPPPPSIGNTAGMVAGMPVATGGAGEYAFSLLITSSTVSGVTAGQLVWCAATTADFPNLLTVGAPPLTATWTIPPVGGYLRQPSS